MKYESKQQTEQLQLRMLIPETFKVKIRLELVRVPTINVPEISFQQ